MLRNDIPEDHRVIVRVWPTTSSFSISKNGSLFSLGHVSIQTFTGGDDDKGYYISLWPADPQKQRCCGNPNDHFHAREEDVQYCGQAHVNYTYTFYLLDPYSINHHYEFLREHLRLRYNTTGVINTQDDICGSNCTTLVYELLQKGAHYRYYFGDDDLKNKMKQLHDWKEGMTSNVMMLADSWLLYPLSLAASLIEKVGTQVFNLNVALNLKPDNFIPIMIEAIKDEHQRRVNGEASVCLCGKHLHNGLGLFARPQPIASHLPTPDTKNNNANR